MAVLKSNCHRPHYAYKMEAYWPARRHKPAYKRTNIRTAYGQWQLRLRLRTNKQNYGLYESAHTTTQNHLKAIISDKHGGYGQWWCYCCWHWLFEWEWVSPCSKHGVQWINLRNVTKPQLQAPAERQRRETKRQLWKEQRVQLHRNRKRNSTDDSHLSMRCTIFGATLNDAGAWSSVFAHFFFFLFLFAFLGSSVFLGTVLMDNCRARMQMRGILERVKRVAAAGLAIRTYVCTYVGVPIHPTANLLIPTAVVRKCHTICLAQPI